MTKGLPYLFGIMAMQPWFLVFGGRVVGGFDGGYGDGDGDGIYSQGYFFCAAGFGFVGLGVGRAACFWRGLL